MKQHWTKLELIDFWTLSIKEKEYINNKKNKLSVAIKIRYFDQQGHFPYSGSDIPFIILEYVANQLGVSTNEIDQYSWQTRSSQIHNQEIREYYGYSTFKDSDLGLVEKLVEDKFTKEALSVNLIIEKVYKLLKNSKIEPPSGQETYKHVNNIYNKCEQQFFDKCFDAIESSKQANILKLLDIGDDNQTILSNIRVTTGKVSSSTVTEELAKLSHIESTSILNNVNYKKISRKLLKNTTIKSWFWLPLFYLELKSIMKVSFILYYLAFVSIEGQKL